MLLRSYGSDLWANQTVRKRLSWYFMVMRNLRPAKFLICKQIASSKHPQLMTEAQLWQEHESLRLEFLGKWKKIEQNEALQKGTDMPEFNFLGLKVELLNRILRKCVLCEWRCKVDRVEGKRKGACHLDTTARLATFFRHFGEEPPLVDRKGSGTIFFASCTFRCAFCQNWDISQDQHAGTPVSPGTLSRIMKSLRSEGAANINLVGGEPTPNLHVIMEAINLVSVNVPIVWNSNMYLTPEVMRILADIVDLWLPDFKWGNDSCALKYSRISRYFEVVSRNHAMIQGSGDLIIRHLVMPGHVECCTKPVLDWIAENCSRALVNLMSQYRPEHLVVREPMKYHEIVRRPSLQEMRDARTTQDRLGLVWEPVS